MHKPIFLLATLFLVGLTARARAEAADPTEQVTLALGVGAEDRSIGDQDPRPFLSYWAINHSRDGIDGTRTCAMRFGALVFSFGPRAQL
jgi:hypothetical protein